MRRLPIGRRIAELIAFVSLVCALAPCASAGASADVLFGFDGQLIHYRYAPLRVEVTGLSAPVEGRILVKQFAGADPSNPVTISHEIARGRIENGTYEAALPAYDLVLPVLVQVLGPSDEVLASATKSVRQAGRGLPFIVFAGDSRLLSGTESIVSASELPADWWAYEPVKSLWLTEPLLDQAVWQALGEWVAAGGSLVLFSGSDFYQWDCPAARALLPFTAPTLRELAPGSFLLTGTPRAGAQVLLSRDDEPLLVRIQHGAGYTSLVTRRLRDLGDADLQRVAAHIPDAKRLVVVDRLTQDGLNDTPVVRPLYAFAPIVVTAVLAGFVAFHRRSGRASFAASCALLLAGIAAAAVASGFYVNRAGSVAYEYTINTHFAVHTSFDIALDSYGFFSVTPTSVALDHDKRRFPIQADLWITNRSAYALDSDLTGTQLALPACTRRFVRACGTEDANWSLSVLEGGHSFRVVEHAGRSVQAVLLFLDGLFYEVPVAHGRPSEEFAFEDLRHVSPSSMSREEFALYTGCVDWLSPSAEAWLLTYEESSAVSVDEEAPAKVSLVRIEVVEGERMSRPANCSSAEECTPLSLPSWLDPAWLSSCPCRGRDASRTSSSFPGGRRPWRSFSPWRSWGPSTR